MKQRRENNPQFSYQNVMKFPVSFHSNVVKKVERHENLLKKDEHRENVRKGERHENQGLEKLDILKLS